MALAFETSLAFATGSGISQTRSITIGSISNGFMTIAVLKQKNNSTCTGVTVNGSAATKVDTVIVNSVEENTLWRFLNPPAGTYDIVASFSGPGISGIAVSVHSGAEQGAPEDHGTYYASYVTTVEKALTTVSAGSWLVGWARCQVDMTAGTNTYFRSASSGNTLMIDTNGASDATKKLIVTQQSAGYGTVMLMSIKAVSVAPTVTTQAVSDITPTTATGNGNITATGGEDCDKRGIVYATSSQSAPGDVAPGSSGYSSYEEDSGSTYSTGAFTKDLTSLTSGQTYYVRAYAHNSAGYAYGDEVSFTTVKNVSISQGVESAIFSIPAYGLSLGISLSPSVQTASFTVPSYTILSGDTLQSPSTQVGTFFIPTYGVLYDTLVEVLAQSAIFSVPSMTVSINKIMSVDAQSSIFSIPGYFLSYDYVVSQNVLEATFSIPAYSSIVETRVTPDAQVVTTSIPAYALEIGSTISMTTQVMIFSIPTLQKYGGVWVKSMRPTTADWSKTSVNND